MKSIISQFVFTVLAVLLTISIQAQDEKPSVKKSNNQVKEEMDAPPPIPSPVAQEEIFKVVEQMPRFPGCEDKGLSKKEVEKCASDLMSRYIGMKLKYPAKARKNGTQGTVVIQFIVGKDGSILEPTIIRDVGHGCGSAALSVIRKMQSELKWIPGKQRGRPVKVQYTMPVSFKL